MSFGSDRPDGLAEGSTQCLTRRLMHFVSVAEVLV